MLIYKGGKIRVLAVELKPHSGGVKQKEARAPNLPQLLEVVKMGKKDRKKILVSIPIIIIVAFLTTLFLFPGLLESIGALITGQVNYCDDAPYNTNCYCLDSENKIQILGTFPDKFACENKELMFNPENPTFDEDTLVYAKNYLYENFPLCDSVECEEPAILYLSDTIYLPDHRSMYFECRTPWGKDYWEILFDLEAGNVEKVFCNNVEEAPPIGENPGTISIAQDNLSIHKKRGTLKFDFILDAPCETTNGTGTTTINAPENVPVEKWSITGNGWGYYFVNNKWRTGFNSEIFGLETQVCKLTNPTSSNVKLECNKGCPNAFLSGSGIVFGFVSQEYLNQNFCMLNNPDRGVEYYSIGEQVICNDDRHYHYCNTNLEWEINMQSSTRTSGTSLCPGLP